MANAIVKPSLIINGEVINIVPNSLIVVLGTGEKEVKVQSAGGDQLENVIFDNIETAVGQIKFKQFNTSENLSALSTVRQNGSDNKVQFTSSEGVNGTLKNAIIINDPEINFSIDGETEYQMKGSPIV